jgi:lysophospholipase L1-like esterase
MKMHALSELMSGAMSSAAWGQRTAALAVALFLGGCLDAGRDALSAEDVRAEDGASLEDTVPADDTRATDLREEGPDAEVSIEDVVPDPVDVSPPQGIAALARYYADPEGRAQSGWVQRPSPEADGFSGLQISLLTPGAPTRTASTDTLGMAVFDALEAGRHMLLAADGPEETCTSNNMPRRFADAMLEGQVTVVSFGDSVPHWGPTPWFPARLEAILDEFVDAEDVNIAVPGSTSVDWLPGGAHFGRLSAAVEDADLAVFSLGGNDVTFYLSDFVEVDPAELLENIDYYLGLLDAKIAEIADNLKAIIASVRAVNPDIDIVWFIYPNYAWNDYWAPYLGEWAPFVRPLLDERLDTIRFLMSRSDVMLADMHAAIPGEEVAGLMVDELHLNAAGHARYAEELFLLLGGITVGADTRSSRGLNRSYGFQ